MKDNYINERKLTEWLKIKQAFEPYLPKENRKIYRSVVGLDKNEYGYYCNLDIENSVVQTAIKPLQNWSYSKKFVDKWGDNNYKGHVKLIFQSNTKKLYNNIIFEPKAVMIYFSKIAKFFPKDFNRLKNDKMTDINFIFNYLNGDAKELLLYSPNGDLFVEKMEVYGC